MAARAISALPYPMRATTVLTLLALLLSLFPCTASTLPSRLIQAHPHMSAGVCAPCCKGSPVASAHALCCAAHPQPASTSPALDPLPTASHITRLTSPQSLYLPADHQIPPHPHQPRSTLLSILRI